MAALTEDRHAGKIYDLSGPRQFSFADVAAEIVTASGREIACVPMVGQSGQAAGVYAYFTGGRYARLVRGVEEALGRKPKDFSDFARDAAATGAWKQ